MNELSKHAMPLGARAVFEGDDDAFVNGCYVKSYNTDGSVKELAGDCADDVRGK